MSTKCKIWDCDNLRSCPCFGMCGLHTAANATWQCEHLSGKAYKVDKCAEQHEQSEPVAVEPVAEQHEQSEPVDVEPVDVEPVAVEPVDVEPPPVMMSILRPAYVLPDVIEDETPSPLKTPEPNECNELADSGPQPDPVETLAALHTEHMSQIMAEMEAMRAKLKEYEEQKAIIENIQQLEAKCAKLETYKPLPAKNEIPASQPVKPNTARSASNGPAKRQTLQKIASSNSNVGPRSTVMQTKQKK